MNPYSDIDIQVQEMEWWVGKPSLWYSKVNVMFFNKWGQGKYFEDIFTTR